MVIAQSSTTKKAGNHWQAGRFYLSDSFSDAWYRNTHRDIQTAEKIPVDIINRVLQEPFSPYEMRHCYSMLHRDLVWGYTDILLRASKARSNAADQQGTNTRIKESSCRFQAVPRQAPARLAQLWTGSMFVWAAAGGLCTFMKQQLGSSLSISHHQRWHFQHIQGLTDSAAYLYLQMYKGSCFFAWAATWSWHMSQQQSIKYTPERFSEGSLKLSRDKHLHPSWNKQEATNLRFFLY